MAKKSRKKPARLKKDNAGCMSGLISMFDFRQGQFTQKLLSDKKCGSGRLGETVYPRNKIDFPSKLEEACEDFDDNDVKKVEGVKSGKASIKSLMAKEMSGSNTLKKMSSTRVEQLRSELGFETNLEKNQRTTNKTYKIGPDHYSTDSRASQFASSDPSETSSFDINLTELMLEFCSENPKCQDKNIECIRNKKNDCRGDLGSEHFTDAIQNKEVFLKLFQNPDPLLMQRVQNHPNAETSKFLHEGKPKESVSSQLSQSRHHFFRKKDRSDGSKPTNESSQVLKRIVVLKPTPTRHQQFPDILSPLSSPKSYHSFQQNTEGVPSQFSLKEIRRRLRNMIGERRKDRHLIAMDGILHKVPYGYRNGDESEKATRTSKQTPKLSTFIKIGNISSNLRENQPQKKTEKANIPHPTYRESVFYDEARKHLAEMISSGGETEISSRRVSKQLGRILSIPEYNSLSPRLSPRKEEIDSPRLMKVPSLRKIQQDDSTSMNNPSTLSTETLSCCDSKQLRIEEDLTPNGSTKIEECGGLNVPEEVSMNKPDCISERSTKEVSHTISDSVPIQEVQPMNPCISMSPNFSLAQKIESSENAAENMDRPSPVSVLEPFFSEEIISPECTETTQAGLRIDPQQLTFEEHSDSPLISTAPRSNMDNKEMKLKYIRSVLEASGLSYNKFPERWQYSDQLLDPFVYDEVEISFGELIPESKNVFDCIDEVLVQIKNRYLSYSTPWASIIKPNIRPVPIGENFVQEVWKRIEGQLYVQFPCTLDQIVRKDLDGGSWMNASLETEGAVTEIGEVILDYIMEETILELWE